MPSSKQDRYLLQLNRALAMESALVDHLEKRAQEINSPKIKERVEQHRGETIEHRETVRGVIQSLGGQPTSGKASVQSPISPGLIGTVKSALEGEKEDKALSQTLADYSVEEFEAALYLVLAQIARNLGHSDHAPLFDRIRREEQGMAEFLASCGPEVVDEAFPPISGERAA